MAIFTRKFIAIISVIAFLPVLIYLLLRADVNTTSNSVENAYVIEYRELGERIHIHAKSWGLNGDHQVIAISNTIHTANIASKDSILIFYYSEAYYKKIGKDTLLVYGVNYVDNSKKMSTKVKIIPVNIAPRDTLIYFEKNYSKYGLSKATVY